jgi:hypothetical protein
MLTFTAGGCARLYSPRALHVAHSRDASIEATHLATLPGSAIYPPVGGIVVEGKYSNSSETSLGGGRISAASEPPCSGGVATSTLYTSADEGTFVAGFHRDSIDRQGLLAREATSLDVTVLDRNATPQCVRVPMVVDPKTPEWSQSPIFSFGYGIDVLVPFHPIYAVDAASMFVVRMGPWIGPVRLRTELGIGGALMRNPNANLVGYAYRAGLLIDTLLLHRGRFGLGVGAGYDTTGISLGANVEQLSHEGEGFQGLISGPRGGVSFALLPQVPPGPAFEARPDAASATFEIYVASETSHDRASATPALWLTFSTDAGL